MSIGRTIALTAGFVGSFAMGVAVGPAVWDRFGADQPQVAAAPAAEPMVVERPAVSRRARAVTSGRAAETREARETREAKATAEARETAPAVALTEPTLHARLKPVMNRGTKMELAAEGFRNAEQFATVAHAARNTEVPFMVLKHRVLTEGRTLASAIRESKPDLDAAMEVQKARDEAREDLAALAAGN